MDLFRIENPLLQKAIFGNTICKNVMNNCNGYLNNDFNAIGRGFIEFCVAKEFNIHRLPGFEQYYIKDGLTFTHLKEFSSLNKKDILNACCELKRLYEFTQSKIDGNFSVNDKKIELYRNLCKYEEKYVASQINDNLDIIELPVNIINSYSYSKLPFGYSSNIFLTREVKIENILMIDKFVEKPDCYCTSIKDDEHEIWVIEDDMFGLIHLNRNCFKIKNDAIIKERNNISFSPNKTLIEDSLLYSNNMLPCDYNKFTKYIIEKNKVKINKSNQTN